MRRQGPRRTGFTLIEVTLAIVIGVIMIAGAILIYNQAKVSAGNSRAQEKVASLQGLVEDYMARSDGIAPSTDNLRAMWVRARPDDWNKSPWGGVMGPNSDISYNGTACGAAVATSDEGGIIAGNCWDPEKTELLPTGTYTLTNPADVNSEGSPVPAPSPPPGSPAWGGTLIYYDFPTAGNYRVWDESRRIMVLVTTYAVASTDQNGERWFFVKGNQSGVGENGAVGMQLNGQIK